MKMQPTATPNPRSLAEIEFVARRMRAQLLRSAGVGIGRYIVRLFGRGAGGRTAQV